MLDYIAGASLYEVIKNSGKEYRLVHAGLSNFTPDKAMDEYDLYDFLEERTDYKILSGREYLSGNGTYADCSYKRLGKNESIYEKRSYCLGLCLCGGRKTGGILHRDRGNCLCGWTLKHRISRLQAF